MQGRACLQLCRFTRSTYVYNEDYIIYEVDLYRISAQMVNYTVDVVKNDERAMM